MAVQLVTRVPDAVAEAVDDLGDLEKGVFASQSERGARGARGGRTNRERRLRAGPDGSGGARTPDYGGRTCFLTATRPIWRRILTRAIPGSAPLAVFCARRARRVRQRAVRPARHDGDAPRDAAAAGAKLTRDRDLRPRRVYVDAAAGRSAAAVRRRAGRAIRVVRDGRVLRDAVPGHPRAGRQRRRAGAAGLAFAPDYASSGPLLRRLHRHERRHAHRRVPARRLADRADPGSARAAALPGPAGVQPQRRPARVRARRAALRRPRRRRRRRRPARPDRQRAEPRHAARQDPADRSAAVRRAPVRGSRATTRSSAGAARSGEIYAWGLRNPWRFSFDRATGDLTIGDVGQDHVEESTSARAGRARGANFGWRAWEGRPATSTGRARRRATSSRRCSTRTTAAAARSPAAT